VEVFGQYEVGQVATQVLLAVRRNVPEQDVQEVDVPFNRE